MRGCDEAAASLAPISASPLSSTIVAPKALLRLSAKRSRPSATASSMISTTTVFTESPGAKVSVPLFAT
jgi:hypothetical protein